MIPNVVMSLLYSSSIMLPLRSFAQELLRKGKLSPRSYRSSFFSGDDRPCLSSWPIGCCTQRCARGEVSGGACSLGCFPNPND